jgi:hypothetical protein
MTWHSSAWLPRQKSALENAVLTGGRGYNRRLIGHLFAHYQVLGASIALAEESNMNEYAVSRRDFVKGVASIGGATVLAAATRPSAAATVTSVRRIETLDYQNVSLGRSHWQRQYQLAHEFYSGVSNDDILHGFRRAAGLAAPGQPLGGWQARNSAGVFGQWLSGMSRFHRGTGDDEMRNKIVYLADEWSKTIGADGDCGMRHYPFEKLVGGLVDMKLNLGYDAGIPVLRRVTEWATRTFDRTRTPAGPLPWELHSGRPLEWYTVAENSYRAFELTGDEAHKDFADLWLYPAYWNKFADSFNPTDAWGVHAYSHVNTFSSAAMAYAITGEPSYLQILKNAYDFLQNTQCFATGGFGPAERILPTNGNLGRSLEFHQNTCETPCCSWAAFKLARYLMTFTGDARYGDWIERLFCNGIGAALPITGNGKNFYYADYRVAGGLKYYARSTYTCCSGTYCQAVAEYPNLIYFKDDASLYVNLYVPSEVNWQRPEGNVKVTQRTGYPLDETSTLALELAQPARFALKFRIPGWSNGVALRINGEPRSVSAEPGSWATLDREWQNGDRVEISIPLRLRFEAVDRWHPDRVAVVRGPVVLVQDSSAHEPIFGLPQTDDELNEWLVPNTGRGAAPGTFALRPPNGQRVQALFQPFYAIPEVNTYRMYFDRDRLPFVLW